MKPINKANCRPYFDRYFPDDLREAVREAVFPVRGTMQGFIRTAVQEKLQRESKSQERAGK